METKDKRRKMSTLDRFEWIQRAIGGLAILKPEDRKWMQGMSRDDLVAWATKEYERHYDKDGYEKEIKYQQAKAEGAKSDDE